MYSRGRLQELFIRSNNGSSAANSPSAVITQLFSSDHWRCGFNPSSSQLKKYTQRLAESLVTWCNDGRLELNVNTPSGGLDWSSGHSCQQHECKEKTKQKRSFEEAVQQQERTDELCFVSLTGSFQDNPVYYKTGLPDKASDYFGRSEHFIHLWSPADTPAPSHTFLALSTVANQKLVLPLINPVFSCALGPLPPSDLCPPISQHLATVHTVQPWAANWIHGWNVKL